MVDFNLSSLVARSSAAQVRGTRTRTSYAAEIHLRAGGRYAVVGGVQEFTQRQAQQVVEEYTVRRGSRGMPEALIPQNMTTRTIQLVRFDLFSDVFERVFRLNAEFTTLSRLGSAFEIREVWTQPAASTSGLASLAGVGDALTVAQGVGTVLSGLATPETYVYLGCRFTEFGRSLRVDNRIVGVNATIMWRDRKKLS